MSDQRLRNLIVSYVPEHHLGDPLLAIIPFSESYEVLIDAACKIYARRLPPEDRIATRTLAHRIQPLDSAPHWETLQPGNLPDIIRKMRTLDETLELRLTIEWTPASSSSSINSHLGSEWMSALEKSSPNLLSPHSLNPGRHDGTIESSHSSAESQQPSTAYPVARHTEAEEQIPTSPSSSTSPFALISKSLSPLFSQFKPPTDENTFVRGIEAFHAGKYSESQTHLLQAASEFHRQGDTLAEAGCFRHIGISCRNLKDHVTARSYLWAARAMYESLGSEHQREQFRCSRHLALVEEDLGNHGAALRAYQELLLNAEQKGFLTQRAWCLCYIGHLLSKMGQYDEAEVALKSSMERKNLEIEAFAAEGLGDVQERQGNAQVAMRCYKDALRKYRTGGHVGDQNRLKKRIGRLGKDTPEPGVSRRWSIARSFK